MVPLPAPLGLICIRKLYPLLTSFCFVSMANGINLTDGLDGLAAGTAALAFIGMSIVVLPICPGFWFSCFYAFDVAVSSTLLIALVPELVIRSFYIWSIDGWSMYRVSISKPV